MQSATCVDEDRQIKAIFTDGLQSKYPYIWLLDNCRCTQCYVHSANQRLVPFSQLDFRAVPESVTLTPDGSHLSIKWSKGHIGDYSVDWLRTHQFDSSKPDEVAEPQLHIWGSEMVNTIPTYDFEGILNNEAELYKWLDSLNASGLALIKNVPQETGQIKRVAKRVSFLKPTNYGVCFSVKSKMNPSNTAYTAAGLSLHTDLSNYNHAPGVQMLHCIQQYDGEGGDSEFTDGFKAAIQLKKENPKAFEILTTTWLNFSDIGIDYYSYHFNRQSPTICLGRKGNIEEIAYSRTSLSSMMYIPVEQVESVYEALKAFSDIMYNKENIIKFKMESGDMVAFNNIRVLHGRSAFKVEQRSSRHLEGGYIDWDEIHSRMRVLKANLQI
ncbi:gamma-butyrobetaine dioxygenase-like [Saccoglossus kowalevskii]|uniref:Gamma-butyrobetaine dioxygenase-like n=1 Tax=Saccoglossus kowalevskii TaxID=10224 RepID=A0ABM0GTE6_SACKO|nr:PREDICTED: gamma-butyrobetaine dioxygenase-like [Saccoglossus kowalevskii]